MTAIKKRFKVKTSNVKLFANIFMFLVVTVPFLVIPFIRPGNIVVLPFSIVWCLIVSALFIFRIRIIINVITLDEKAILVPNNNPNIQFEDICDKIKIRNGRLVLPYEDILSITAEGEKIYIECKQFLNTLILILVDIDNFIFAVNEMVSQANASTIINIVRI